MKGPVAKLNHRIDRKNKIRLLHVAICVGGSSGSSSWEGFCSFEWVLAMRRDSSSIRSFKAASRSCDVYGSKRDGWVMVFPWGVKGEIQRGRYDLAISCSRCLRCGIRQSSSLALISVRHRKNDTNSSLVLAETRSHAFTEGNGLEWALMTNTP